MTGLSFDCDHRYGSGFTLRTKFTAERPVTALFGPSGSGKTTILESIAGLIRPDRGRIAFGDRTLFDSAAGVALPPEQRGAGVVFQDQLLFPHRTVERNLRYGERRRSAFDPASDPAAASTPAPPIDLARVAEILELTPLLNRRPAQLSGGERQRVALGRALLSRPDFLLLDEPLAALDESLKLRILAYVERIVATWRIPVLFISHSQTEVRRLAEWVVLIEGGEVRGAGPPDQILTGAEFLTREPREHEARPINLLRLSEIRREHDRIEGRIDGPRGPQWLRLPDSVRSLVESRDAPTAPPLYVRFSPGAVLLARADIAGLSARNHLQGVVRDVVDLPGGVLIRIDVGAPLWAEVTSDAARELSLNPGAEVVCLLKAHSLEVI